MGNCVFKGRLGRVAEEKAAVIKVVTPNGGVMELQSPIRAGNITNEFPGHAIFPIPHHSMSDILISRSQPLLHHEQLCAGQSYYLLPLQQDRHSDDDHTVEVVDMDMIMPYRMSVDHKEQQQQQGTTSSLKDAFPRRYNSSSRGVWKVRLAINSDQLLEILSHEARTEALIESVRTVAKCASGVQSPVKSDQRSWTSTAITS